MNPAYALRLFGAALIVAVCTLMGYEKALSFKARCEFLKEFIGALEVIKTEISFVKTTIGCVFDKLQSYQRTGKLFAEAKKFMQIKGLEAAWNQSVKENAPASYLTGEDIEAIKSLGEGLGKSDVEGQLAHTQYCRELLERQLSKAVQQQKKNGGLYQKGGLLIGIFIAILLL